MASKLLTKTLLNKRSPLDSYERLKRRPEATLALRVVLKGKIIDKSCHCGEKDSKSLLFYSSTKTLRQCRTNLLFTKLSTESDQLYSRKKVCRHIWDSVFSNGNLWRRFPWQEMFDYKIFYFFKNIGLKVVSTELKVHK